MGSVILRAQLQLLIERHGIIPVMDALYTVLSEGLDETTLQGLSDGIIEATLKGMRRAALATAARKLNLIPHTVGQAEIEGREN